VAVIKIVAKDLPYLELGDSTSLEVGELVMAIGNPFELFETVTLGVVSAKGRNQLHINDFEDFIQTDAAINPGNSGGPLINMDGKVIGMNTAIVSPGRTGYIGIGFAVPAHLMKPVMDQLIKNGKVVRGFLGIVLQPVDADLASSFGLDKPQGALIAEVTSDSPAASSDLKSGDIILKYNNKPVVNISDFRTNISMLNPGTQLNLTVYREGKTMNIPVQVGSQSEKNEDETVEALPVSNQLGLSVEELTPELAQRFGYAKDSGVIVSKVAPDSLGDKAGIKPGTLIMAIDRNKITSVADFSKAVGDGLNAKHILLLVKQGAATRYIALKF
jgi:serine protease Do